MLVTEPVMEKSEEQTYYHQSLNAWKRCRKRSDEAGIHYTGILDRFFEDARYREAQQRLGRTEAKCKEMDALVQEDHTHMATKEELERYRSMWTLQLKDPTFCGPLFFFDTTTRPPSH